MPTNKALVEEIESSIARDFTLSYSELKRLHSNMLDQITSTASRSPAYSKIEHITDLSQLSKLPMTSFDQIQVLFDMLGAEKVLLKKPAIFWYTSGSTGKQKKVYYGEADEDIIAQGFMQLLYLSGVRVTDSAFVFTSTGGDLIKELLNLIKRRQGKLT
jgi:phenylacetate-coenzyme A ligase PaaK-like adenylate-forming protein